jgi:hypothetical protein
MNYSTTDETIRTFRWRPAEGSILLDVAGLGFYVISGLSSGPLFLRIFAGAVAATSVLNLGFRFFGANWSYRTRMLFQTLPGLALGLFLVMQGPLLLGVGVLIFSVWGIYLGLRTPSFVEIRWYSLVIGPKTIPYDAVRFVEVLAKPKSGARAVIHLQKDETPLLWRLLKRNSSQIKVCVSEEDAVAFAKEVRPRAHIPASRGY